MTKDHWIRDAWKVAMALYHSDAYEADRERELGLLYEAAVSAKLDSVQQENARLEALLQRNEGRVKNIVDDALAEKVRLLELQNGLGKELAERVLECSSQCPHSVVQLAFAFQGKKCECMSCCVNKRHGLADCATCNLLGEPCGYHKEPRLCGHPRHMTGEPCANELPCPNHGGPLEAR